MKEDDVFGKMIYDAGYVLYVYSLRFLRWMRIPVFLFGVGVTGIGLWKIFHNDLLGLVIALSGALLLAMNVSTWKLVDRFTKHTG